MCTFDRSPTPYSGTLSMSCSLAASLHMRERHVVIHTAERNLGQSVSRIETMSAYSCRHVNSARAGRWRKHANGDAVNIAGIQLANGTEVMVKDELGKDASRGRFLKEVREEACGLFCATLSPDYNKLHADHLLFDMGFATSCS
ncbi:MAG: extensin family protein [Hyphomonadaceae bacterium]